MQVFFNSDGTSVTAYITIIDTTGAHVDPDSWPITNDPAIVLSSHPSAAKTVTAIDTGVYKVVWTGLSAALSHGDVVHISIDGAINGTAWTTWIVPIQVVLLPTVYGQTLNASVVSMDANVISEVQSGVALESSIQTAIANIATLNNISVAQVLEQVSSGLALYDSPTRTELITEINANETKIDGVLEDTSTTIPNLITQVINVSAGEII